MPIPGQIGGWSSIAYTLRKARASGGIRALYRAMKSKNTCKTCAVGMGGQAGGMVNEMGHFPEFCKKSVQAMAADMQEGIAASFWEDHSIDMLRSRSPREMEEMGRLTQPVLAIRGESHFRPITWEDALGRIASKMHKTKADESFFYFSGRSSNEAAFLLQLFARLYGTNNVNNCSYYCHQASGVGLSSVIGSGTATVVLEDLEKTDLVFVIGANPASNHPRLIKPLMKVRRRGGGVVVINPIREPGLEKFNIPSSPRSLLLGSKIASRMVQPHIGGDLALLCGVAKQLIEDDTVDRDFLHHHTSGWQSFLEGIRTLNWAEIESGSGVSRNDIRDLAGMYAKSTHTVFSWAMGVTHHQHGTETVQMIAALALMRGMIGKKGAGLMPIRGHSNVQGIGSVGVTPTLKKAIFDGLVDNFGLELPTTPGLDTMACMEAAGEGAIRLGFCLGGNLFGSNPDALFAGKALSNLEMLVTMSTTLNTGHAWAIADETIILPVLPRDEEPMTTTQESMFNYVRLSDGGEPRVDGPRSEVSIVADLASRVASTMSPSSLDAIQWNAMNDTAGIRHMISEVVPGWQAIGEIDETGKEFQIEGRTFHTPVFAMPQGKATIHVQTLPGLASPTSPEFRLMTIRSEGQFNTVVYEDYDLYRGVGFRDAVLMHPDDIHSLEAEDGARVSVTGPGGRLPNYRLHSFDRIRPGNVAMYFPEANVLLDRGVDSKSKTPAFKGAIVRVEV